MNVSAVECTPIKPQVSFGESDEEHKLHNYEKFADEVSDEFVNSSNVKKPVSAAISILLAGMLAFATGKVLAQKVAVIAEKFKLNLPEMFDKFLKTISKKATEIAGKLENKNPATAFDKFKNLAGKAIAGGEKTARELYKKVAYGGPEIAEDVAVKQAQAFANLGGMVGIATAFPSVVSKDSNDDGVADILQRGQNAYTGAKTKMGQLMEKAGKFSELVDLLT